MKITKEWLTENGACKEATAHWSKSNDNNHEVMLRRLLQHDHFQWANWLIVRLITHDQKIIYAIYAAESVIKIYEDKYPNDDRPRKAIEAAKGYLKTKNSYAAAYSAYAAADAAYAAAYAAYVADVAYAADAAAYSAYAAYAAYAAAYVADAAAYVADAAADAADAAAYSAARAAYAAYAAAYSADLKTKIIEHGIELLRIESVEAQQEVKGENI